MYFFIYQLQTISCSMFFFINKFELSLNWRFIWLRLMVLFEKCIVSMSLTVKNTVLCYILLIILYISVYKFLNFIYYFHVVALKTFFITFVNMYFLHFLMNLFFNLFSMLHAFVLCFNALCLHGFVVAIRVKWQMRSLTQ